MSKITKEDLHPDNRYSHLDWSHLETTEEISRLAALGLWAEEHALKALRDDENHWHDPKDLDCARCTACQALKKYGKLIEFNSRSIPE